MKWVTLLALGLLLVLGIALLPPEPAFGPYSRFDLISFREYRSISVPEVLEDNRDVMQMVYQLGLRAAMNKVALDPAYELNDSACHGAAHVVGRMAFNLMGARSLLECTTQCFSGCFHGALQGMGARSAGSVGELASEIRDMCAQLPTVFERSECVHGAGHGFLLYANYQLDDALTACELLETPADSKECYAGVFMENLIGDSSEQRFRTDNLHYPCNQYDDPVIVEACYRLQPGRFLEANDNNFIQAQHECQRAPKVAQDACFMRLGQLSGADTENPPAETETFCERVPDEFYDVCILGGLRQVIRVNGIDPSGTAAGFCRALTAPRAKEVCYAQYAKELRDIFTDQKKRLQLCTLFEEPYDASCRAIAS